MSARTLSALLLALATSAVAEPRWGLKWKAPDACIDAADLSRAVDAKLGRPAFGADPDVRISGTVETGGAAKWVAHLTLVSRDGDVLGNHEVSSSEASCRGLDGKLAAIVALIIESGAPEPGGKAPVAAGGAGRGGENETYVHIDADKTGVRLVRIAGTSYGHASNGASVAVTHLDDVCGAPCDKVVTHTESQFAIGGDVPLSDAFRLEGFAQGVSLKVTSGSAGLFVLGRVMFIFGLVGAVMGVTFIPLALMLSYSGDFFMTLGVASLVGGAAIGVGGFALASANATRVDVGARAGVATPTTSLMPMTTVARF